MDDEIHRLRKLVDASGYQFQLAVMRQLHEAQERVGGFWRLLSYEHPWNSAPGVDGFVDLIIGTPCYQLVIECKRTRGDAAWVFMAEQRKKKIHGLAVVARADEADGWQPRFVRAWVTPESPTCHFCVVRGSGEEKPSALERHAARLIESALSILVQPRMREDCHDRVVGIPVIVTNAQLSVCTFDPLAVSLETGMLPGDATIERVDWLRFTKSFLTGEEHHAGPGLRRPDHERRAGEQTVLVTTATGLLHLLPKLDVRFEGV